MTSTLTPPHGTALLVTAVSSRSLTATVSTPAGATERVTLRAGRPASCTCGERCCEHVALLRHWAAHLPAHLRGAWA